METGHVVRFASQQYPFLVEAKPCLDLDCNCSIVTLTLSELVPPVSAPRDQLTFTLRVCLRTWCEQNPPPRSLEVESLAHEFLVRFPEARVEELAEAFEDARAVNRRLKSLTLSGSPDKLVAYSDVIDERGGIREGVTEHAYFFMFEGREFLVEDQYCANPECDCRQVHLEFWERVQVVYPKCEVRIRQRLAATFTLAGQLQETRFSEESAATTKHLLRAWLRRCSAHLKECSRRYEVIKTVGARSFPSPSKPRGIVASDNNPRPVTRTALPDVKQSVRRNDPCPCGSGLKFKRCCARRAVVTDRLPEEN
jgi:hypothetical protein